MTVEVAKDEKTILCITKTCFSERKTPYSNFYKGSLITNRMSGKSKERFIYVIVQNQSIYNFSRKNNLPYCILFQRDDQRNPNTNFGKVFLCSHIEDMKWFYQWELWNSLKHYINLINILNVVRSLRLMEIQPLLSWREFVSVESWGCWGWHQANAKCWGWTFAIWKWFTFFINVINQK